MIGHDLPEVWLDAITDAGTMRGDTGSMTSIALTRTTRREAALHGLALVLLLAAWKATDNEAATQVRRPDVLRGYDALAPRAASRNFFDRSSICNLQK